MKAEVIAASFGKVHRGSSLRMRLLPSSFTAVVACLAWPFRYFELAVSSLPLLMCSPGQPARLLGGDAT